jgi:hypothetical protein
MLDRVGSLGASIAGLMPHEIIPIVGVAQEAAKLVLANRQNRTLLDYQVYLYSSAQAAASGGADIGVLRAGEWIVMGRPLADKPGSKNTQSAYDKPQPRLTSETAARGSSAQAGPRAAAAGKFDNNSADPADFWREPVVWDRRTHQLLHAETGRPVYAPYVSVIVSSADVQVPKYVMDRSADLVKLLSTTAGKSDTDALETSLAALTKTVDAFTLKRRLTRDRDIQDLARLVQALKENIPPKSAVDRERWHAPLNESEQNDMMRFVNSIVQEKGGGPYLSPDTLAQWWDTSGIQGVLVPSPGQPGVRWQPKQPVVSPGGPQALTPAAPDHPALPSMPTPAVGTTGGSL